MKKKNISIGLILILLVFLFYYVSKQPLSFYEFKGSFNTDTERGIVYHMVYSSSCYNCGSDTQIYAPTYFYPMYSPDIDEAICNLVGTPTYRSGSFYKCDLNSGLLKSYKGEATATYSGQGCTVGGGTPQPILWSYDMLSYDGPKVTIPATGWTCSGTYNFNADIWFYFPELYEECPQGTVRCSDEVCKINCSEDIPITALLLLGGLAFILIKGKKWLK